ncbi:helix-turn-helix domain-containing protein [Streptomyces reniochalinae]|uniref:AraC family transcriptional regulator n=1 Tax=Streptomyces reniochalinae TaxID=2250578 RepID=A0A367F2J1_9ACTN|nr:AraC family transcriptional regulator [Streptomyces reniochalinae]RCG24598.1 AraC family transcriptional regulator [Streptomyces reniochalinae]
MDRAPTEPPHWTGTGSLLPGRLLYAGPFGTAALHAHHAVQVLATAREPFRLQDACGHRVDGCAAVIPADAPHAVSRGTSEGVMLHLAPEGTVGGALDALPADRGCAHEWTRTAYALPCLAAYAERHPAGAPGEASAGVPPPGGPAPARVEELTAALDARFGSASSRTRHPAVRSALRLLPERLPGTVRLGEVARAAGLSEGRFAHVFRAEVGLPFRAYVRWLRTQRAVELIEGGRSLSDAAHEAGFADAAHFSRSCKRLFGMAPSEPASGITWVPGPHEGRCAPSPADASGRS